MSRILNKMRLAGQLTRSMGPRWLAFRVAYAVRSRSGAIERRLPARTWDELGLRGFLKDKEQDLARPEACLARVRSGSSPFFFSAADRPQAAALLRSWDDAEASPEREAQDLSAGALRYFSKQRIQVGCPPDWHANPLSGQTTPTDRHWTRIGDFGHGDIKVVWEASRFAFVYPLVRAYWRTGDETYAELFWTLVEDWRTNNPPQHGANWKCGQEVAFRLMAWCFGLHGFLDAAATTPARVADLVQMIAVSGQRIDGNIDYAISQKNNHGVSEGMGLWTVGLLFPELRSASRWRDRGRQVLQRHARELIDDDGAFAQHSMNYHRVMLHDYLWSARLGQLHGQPLEADVLERVGRAGDFLYQVQDPETGRVPCYGQNDGALILPLSRCDYQDFRPVTQAAGWLKDGRRRHADGPWDEAVFWLFGAQAARGQVSPPPRVDLQAEAGGYYTLRSPHSFAFTRCGSFRHRPGQADLLHVDLWWRGCNVAIDPGTYSYHAPGPWDNALATAPFHNTVTVDDTDQMSRVSRFLWLPWAKGTKRRQLTSAGGTIAYWEGEHNGYERLPEPVTHRRAILRLGAENWLILDDLTSRGPHRYRLHWLLPDFPYVWVNEELPDVGEGEREARSAEVASLTMETPQGPYSVRMGGLEGLRDASLVRADEQGPRGWRSAYYLDREPALSVALECHAITTRFWTWFGPPGGTIVQEGRRLRLAAKDGVWYCDVTLGTDDEALSTDVRLEAESLDSLGID